MGYVEWDKILIEEYIEVIKYTSALFGIYLLAMDTTLRWYQHCIIKKASAWLLHFVIFLTTVIVLVSFNGFTEHEVYCL